MKSLFYSLLLLPLLLPGCGDAPDSVDNAKPAAESTANPPAATIPDIQELDWDALIPADWQPEKLMEAYQPEGLDEMADDDPRAQDLMAKLQELWDQAPVVQELDGAAIRLPGFVVPLERDGTRISEFLLVPYYGACIHVPPPPANQTVYVITEQGKAGEWELFDTVWVTGTLQVKHTSSEVGETGYTLYASEVGPYEE